MKERKVEVRVGDDVWMGYVVVVGIGIAIW